MIVLVGFMGAGKSTVGRLLAARLGIPFLDSDQVIEYREGRAIAEMFAVDGEAAFRATERDVIASLLRGTHAVLALGGGAIEDAATRLRLREHIVVYLEASLDDVAARVGGDASRPVLAAPGVSARYRDRLPLYEDVADVVVPTAKHSPEEVVAELLATLRDGIT